MARGKLETLLRDAVRWILSLVNPGIFRRALAHATLRREYSPSIASKPFFVTRQEVWDYCIRELGHNSSVIFIEFGVFQGESIKHFANALSNDASIFLGLDTFTGLPEDWSTAGQPRGEYSSSGREPEVQDKRVVFIRGLFQETSEEWLGVVQQAAHTHKIIVHFDADIYSSTLYGLAKMSELGVPLLVIFDEFYGDECRALSDFCSAFLYKTRVLCSGGRSYSRGGHDGKVEQISCAFYIEPRES